MKKQNTHEFREGVHAYLIHFFDAEQSVALMKRTLRRLRACTGQDWTFMQGGTCCMRSSAGSVTGLLRQFRTGKPLVTGFIYPGTRHLL